MSASALRDLADPGVLARLLLLEGVHEVVRHALERDEHLLGAVDDEVPAPGTRIKECLNFAE